MVSHIMSIRDKMEKMKGLADTNLLKAKEQQKVWYDRNARKREFHCNDMVLLLLPTSTNKLLAKWQGPYRVSKRMGILDYLIEMPNRRHKRGM